MKTVDALARAVRSMFRRQRESIAAGRIALGRVSEFAAALAGPLTDCYLAGLKAAGSDDKERARGEATTHAYELAQQLNESTRNMLDADRPLKDVFGTDRAALIAVDQDRKARQTAVIFAAAETGELLEWVTDAKPCPECRRLRGKKVKPGTAFAIVNGIPIYAPTLHPSCRCSVRKV